MIKLEGAIDYAKKNYILIGIGLLVICIIGYFMFSGGVPDNGGAINEVRNELESTRIELEATRAGLKTARDAVSESQRLADQIRQTNSDITREIDSGRTINKEIERVNYEGGDLIKQCQQVLRQVRERGPVGNP